MLGRNHMTRQTVLGCGEVFHQMETRGRSLLIIGVLIFVGVGCSVVAQYAPVTEPATLGVAEEFELWTDCGLAESAVDFDASMWVPIGVDPAELTSPPAGVDRPFDTGTMTLVTPDRAEYRSNRGRTFTFERHEGDLLRHDCWPPGSGPNEYAKHPDAYRTLGIPLRAIRV